VIEAGVTVLVLMIMMIIIEMLYLKFWAGLNRFRMGMNTGMNIWIQ
jgi:hypothetical protein